MQKQTNINTRVTQDMLERIEAFKEHLNKATGLGINRSDAIRLLITAGLDAKDKELNK